MHDREIVVKLRTLTPLWTGGIDTTMDRIHETGIIGSLRWWYEAIVRGLGGRACDPTSNEKCQYDARDKRSPEEQLCPACYIFGTTGWRRRFRLEILYDEIYQDRSSPTRVSAERINPRTKRNPTWWFPGHPQTGTFTIKIQSFSRDFQPEIIAGLIQFIVDWAALGAKTQMGFGVVELIDDRIDTQPFFEWLGHITGSQTYPDLPSLQNIFLSRISPKNGNSFNEQDTFNLKYDLRQLFTKNRDIRHFVMGKVYTSGERKGDRIATKVKISRPYNDRREIRIWGWIPEKVDVNSMEWNREEIMMSIYDHLSKNYTIQIWREMNSQRDTVIQNLSEPKAFLRSLLNLGD